MYSENTKEFIQYMNKFKNLRRLNNKESINLSKKVIIGDQDAKDKLINHHMYLVFEVVLYSFSEKIKYYGYDELVSMGTEGLLNAAKKFDYTQNVPFYYFAKEQIRYAILNSTYYDNLTNLGVSKNLINDFVKFKKVYNDYYNEQGRYPDQIELENLLPEFTRKHINELVEIFNLLKQERLDKTIDDESDTSLLSTIADVDNDDMINKKNNIDVKRCREILEDVCGALPPNEQTICKCLMNKCTNDEFDSRTFAEENRVKFRDVQKTISHARQIILEQKNKLK